MPRKIDSPIETGGGRPTPKSRDYELSGPGMAGAGPNIGGEDWPLTAFDGTAVHVQQTKGAHKASSISRDLHPDLVASKNVEGALDELSGALPSRPPTVGTRAMNIGEVITGIPDWGVLKLNDSDLITQGFVAGGNDPSDVYPYYWTPVAPTEDNEFLDGSEPSGRDPITDELWNTGCLTLQVPGGGIGASHAGAFSYASGEVLRTVRTIHKENTPDPGNPGFMVRKAVTVSGMVYPADRGVLALLHFDDNAGAGSMADMMTDFLAQDLQDRVVAALLLGQGIDGACQTGDCEDLPCDGEPGGIFALGVQEGEYDPFSFPGQASGQYDLLEIQLGVDNLDGNPLVEPWNDWDDDGNPGAQRGVTTNEPGPGQVRLGTNPDAGETPIDYGIPVLGSTQEAYTPAAQGTIPTALLEDGVTVGLVWNTVLMGTPTNFFRYRLPVLADYTDRGLQWTPKGQNAYGTRETFRYFVAATPNSGNYYQPQASAGSLLTAGYYGLPPVAGGALIDMADSDQVGDLGFFQDNWSWQVARYRHTFAMPASAPIGLADTVGSYMLVHFKKEHDFEAFVRDGIGWWAGDYEVYSAHSLWDVAGTTQPLEHDGNVVNVETDPTVAAPEGTAPDYGYGANPYHALRSSVVTDPKGADDPSFDPGGVGGLFAVEALAGVNEGTMAVSGVQYFIPFLADLVAYNFRFTDMVVQGPSTNWQQTYGTDPRSLTDNTDPPALISSFAPVLLDYSQFCGRNLPTSDVMNADPSNGPVPATDLIPALSGLVGLRHIKVPYTYCGGYTEGAGPDWLNATHILDVGFTGYDFWLFGDQYEPVFSQEAYVRAFINRPLRHDRADYTGPNTHPDGAGEPLINLIFGIPNQKVLWHSTAFYRASLWDVDNRGYGNFTTGALTYHRLLSYFKDWNERFLDEPYRYLHDWTNVFQGGAIPEYDSADAEDALTGPGLGSWKGGPIEVPTKAGLAPLPWQTASWTGQNYHLLDLTATDFLQVAGFPNRNPPLAAGANGAIPSAGVLIYPKTDYTTDYVPVGGLHTPLSQPDYSGAVPGARWWMRVLDLNFTHDGSAPTVARQMEGKTTCLLRFDGVTLEDFTYKAPGPGRKHDDALCIEVKVPGLTTWMDLGRRDGAGPSKQDFNLDGAGCQVVGQWTGDFQDPVTKMVGCIVEVNVGPYATFFKNTGTKGGTYVDVSGATGETSEGECPLLIRVGMTDTAYKYDCAYEYTGGAFGVATDPSASPGNVRGLCGIAVVTEAEAEAVYENSVAGP